MRTYFIPIMLLTLFAVAAFYLTLRQEILLGNADQDLVTASYLDPNSTDDASFVVSHKADTSRVLTIDYRYAGGQTKSETVTLNSQEKRIFSPDGLPLPISITIRYTDSANQEQTLTLYKK